MIILTWFNLLTSALVLGIALTSEQHPLSDPRNLVATAIIAAYFAESLLNIISN